MTDVIDKISCQHWIIFIWMKNQYTRGTLKLRPVKLLFVIFGRLSYSFFVNLMVWGNGQLSYLILKNHTFFTEKWPIFDRFLPKVVQMVSTVTFCQFLKPKIAFLTLGKLISAKISGQNSEIWEIFPVTIFFVRDG